uniref:Putative inorganic phosphate cotransporter n=1 Tax=Graphocephala atropunctata TaxID=36148 RepID=A0A1B6KV19_9HEMI
MSETSQRPPGIGTRHCQGLMTFLSLILDFSIRSNLSVGLVAMTDSTKSNPNFPVLSWTSSQKGIILGSLFWGYFLTTIPGGHFSRKWGAKYLMFGAMLVCALLTSLCPYISLKYGWLGLCLSRVVLGLGQGILLPSVHTHLAKWTPLEERNRTIGFVLGGSTVGTIVTMPIAGYLAASPWGWPSIFYSTGLCGVLWAVVWLFVGADSPDSHPSISDSEREYINESLVYTSAENHKLKTPWKSIVTSVPLWALLITQLGQNWGYWMFLTQLPNYFSHVLNFNIQNNGLMTALPYLVMGMLTIVFSWIADYINAKEILTLNVSRKMWNSLAHYGGAAALLALPLVNSVSGAVILLTTAIAINAGTYTGYLTNPLDLAPNFAGLLMGFTNGFASITAILAPTVTGLIVSDESSREQWEVVFYITAGAFFVGNTVFIFFGSTDVQPWNQTSKDLNHVKNDFSE